VIELIPLCRVEMAVGTALRLGATPAGRRLIGVTAGGRWEGERLRASVEGIAADFMVIGADGTAIIDARTVLRTDDGALVYVTYGGRSHVTDGVMAPFMIAPTFETADVGHAWLNRIQAVGKGEVAAMNVRYEIYEVR
jgi:hypothetical protein